MHNRFDKYYQEVLNGKLKFFYPNFISTMITDIRLLDTGTTKFLMYVLLINIQIQIIIMPLFWNFAIAKKNVPRNNVSEKIRVYF